MKSAIDIRNSDGRLLGRYSPSTTTLKIQLKGCLSIIHFLPNGELEITNVKLKA